ncbi:MAG: amidohydrolase family protein [Acidimicrobiales bacterium]|nr:amidohydrolase family protein [Acidimicrobiales bacterium]
MAYAPYDRQFYDADSHIMEMPRFLLDYADADIVDELKPVSYHTSIVTDDEVATLVEQGGHTPDHVEAQIAMGDQLIAQSKEIQALGAFDRGERTVAMDMLGFAKQLVFATHSPKPIFHPSDTMEPRLRYGATRAHNRAMGEFCANDDRLMGVGVVPLNEIDRAIEELYFALEAGLEAIWVPHGLVGDRSPGHIDLYPFWARLAEAGVPFVLHVGGAPLQLHPGWANTGRPPARDWLGGGENVRSKDYAVMHHGPETFVSMMVLDGVFEKFPDLRGAAVELGAGWVPWMLERLDRLIRSWSKVDQYLAELEYTATETLRRQMGFTPFVFEDVGGLVDATHEDLYLFSSDYPHTEGGKDPIGRFESSLGDRSEAVRNAFYTENFLKLWPDARVA